MLTFRSAWLLSLLLPFCWQIGSSQDDKLPLDTWIKDLSVKEDDLSLKFDSIYGQLAKLDSTKRCDALSYMDQQAPKGNKRLQIRLALLRSNLILNGRACTGSRSPQDLLEGALRLAYEIEDYWLAAEANLYLGYKYQKDYDFGIAAMFRSVAYELRKKAGEEHFKNIAIDLYNYGDLLYHSRDYREAIRISKEAISHPGNPKIQHADTLDSYWKLNAWNVIGLSYEKLAIYDSAMIAFNHALDLSITKTGDPFWKGLLLGNMGDVFFLQGRYDSAEALLKFDYEQSIASQQLDNAALSLSRLAQIYNERGEHQRALTMLREADMLEHRKPNTNYRPFISYAYAIVFKDLGNADSSFFYMQQFKEKSDMLDSLGHASRTEILRMRMENRDKVYQVRALNHEKQKIVLVRNLVITLMLLAAAMGYLYFNRMRLKMQIRQQQILEEKRKIEAEAEQSQNQLNIFTQHLLEKTQLVEQLQKQILEKDTSADQSHAISELTHQTILTDEDWERFKVLFEKVYPGFFYDLRQKTPDITLAEQRIAALIQLRLTVRESATLLGISPNSVYKTRHRLKQRLGSEFDFEIE